MKSRRWLAEGKAHNRQYLAENKKKPEAEPAKKPMVKEKPFEGTQYSIRLKPEHPWGGRLVVDK